MSRKPKDTFYSMTFAEVLRILEVDPDAGLTDEAVARRRDQYGPNSMRKTKGRSAWAILFDQFKSVVIIVLIVAGGVALAFRHWAEAAAIAAVLMVNAAIGFFTEWKAVRSMEALQAESTDSMRVRRQGAEFEIEIDALVPGDIVIFEGGDIAPADVRLIEANRLSVNESNLTGESVPVHKQTEPVSDAAVLAERYCMLYSGTTITEGSGEGVVVATGMQTEMGRIAQLTASAEAQATPLQKRLNQLGRRLALLTLIVAALIALAGLSAGQDLRKMIETAIALGVAAIPEGLPIVATIALARGMRLMARRNVYIRNLPAVETLGATGVIFTDKTGTLTENRMSLSQVITASGDFAFDEKSSPADKGVPEDRILRRAIEVSVLCNNAALRDIDQDDVPDEEQGDPTETALLRAGFAIGLKRPQLLADKPEAHEVPFDAQTMMMATFHHLNGALEVAVKGAPDRVLAACRRIAAANGDELFDEEDRRRWEKKVGLI